jgi:hypothetical protein
MNGVASRVLFWWNRSEAMVFWDYIYLLPCSCLDLARSPGWGSWMLRWDSWCLTAPPPPNSPSLLALIPVQHLRDVSTSKSSALSDQTPTCASSLHPPDDVVTMINVYSENILTIHAIIVHMLLTHGRPSAQNRHFLPLSLSLPFSIQTIS